ncbi:phosphopantothenoylcysteine decarboxylase / phosphopantothenate--cysteine ligase [Atopostipes suicloacalis DSM 15692]|uniref:Coenzyme A biosynthesis bifunctional protein CoaBC n=1 Tax=Atopostipes suicloacalis DSM 15692 TaxID=1121025 RepID=A0A1M4VVL2_9LACT|nr:bifunctional phosphopantothenoylcysteine decarboxylase/phosphopantothenate--cysteine ligase CoaBC [Atopostipes suicloacalis]SHE72988.1 phosphopantothenoylcysteine decarboxylase / phosphopantothenate--cysteine ligase [Atopostipes suicloacalis DSM 15692]
MLKDKKIALYVTGGIAVYKVVDLMRSFIKNGAEVRVAMTESATKFVTPMTFQILSRHEVYVDTFCENNPSHVAHVDLSDWADISVIAPATANTMAKMAYGLADNFVTSALLATASPLFVVPAMNTDMFENPATQENIQTLKSRGIYIVEPDTGFLAEGYEGKGRYPENKRILEELENFIITTEKTLPLRGYKILISAGGTKERIDPVRYITNDSSGKMGHSIAEAAYQYGAEVTLVTASTLESSKAIHRIQVDSASEMFEAIDERFEDVDILIMSAAVSDYGVADAATSKMKKADLKEPLTIELQENPDILKTMGAKKENQFLVGFAAETNQLEDYALKKLAEKNLDLIVANEVGKEGTGFDSDDNQVVIFTKEHQRLDIPKTSKTEIARRILDKVIEELDHHS